MQNEFIIAISSIFALINPFNSLPQCLLMTEGLSKNTRKKVFSAVILVSFMIVIFFILTGGFIMHHFFNIEFYHLRVAGGIILIAMGLKKLMFPVNVTINLNPTDTDRDIIKKAIIPMAFPMMVGPGTLSTIMVMTNDVGLSITVMSATIAFILMFFLFFFSNLIELIAGKLILLVISRIMQVFIVAIGVKILVSGIVGTYKAIILTL